jgi:hypothetical protein
MSTNPTVIPVAENSFLSRTRAILGAAVFLFIRRFPRLLQLHRNEKSWTLFRVALGLFGAALVVLPLSLWHGWLTAIFGLGLFVVSILMPPAETESDTDRKARELGASSVVSGGQYQPGNAPAAETRLFISPAHIWALTGNFEPLLVISTPEIARLWVEEEADAWHLRIRWADHKAEFSFSGMFAERYARLAEESIRGALPSSLPRRGRSRAASN